MKSIKPGRGPSMLGGIMGIFVAIFGVFWTIMAMSMGAPIFFPVFGVGFVIIAVIQAVYNFKNATGKNRYSSYDIVDSREEIDPWNEKYENPQFSDTSANGIDDMNFCPYCGVRIDGNYVYCAKCGKKLP